MNRKQKIILIIGLFLVVAHTVFYLTNLQRKYKKMQIQHQTLKADSQQDDFKAIQRKEDSFRRVFAAGAFVTVLIISATSIMMWVCAKRDQNGICA